MMSVNCVLRVSRFWIWDFGFRIDHLTFCPDLTIWSSSNFPRNFSLNIGAYPIIDKSFLHWMYCGIYTE
jgi:hypothetical protein